MNRNNLRIVQLVLCFFFISRLLFSQHTPWMYWTFLPEEQMNEIIGEASGETAWNTIMETGGYNKDRPKEEYAGTFYEAQYIYDQLLKYGLPEAEIVRFPGGEVWDGIKGELWEISPKRRKIASYRDMTAMLASGSVSADTVAELVWVGLGTEEEIDRADVGGKIVVTEGSIRNVHNRACGDKGAVGVIAISQSRPDFDPLQIPWSGLRGWRGSSNVAPKFGFHLPFREGIFLKTRLIRGETIHVHAQVVTTQEAYEYQDVACRIPGIDPAGDEIILTAHLFEGIVKQGANDNKSGSAGILEVARTLHTLIEEGRLPRPKRSIRFLWGPEFSGTGPWVKANKDIMERTLCNINMDMVGEWLLKNKAFFCLMRTTYANPHYINDVMENYYRFIGESSRERIQNRGNVEKVPYRIVAPTGADEPFYYSIETHYGSSDHEIFNDWSVGVPGIMMIVWPDQWYHTSGDRVDKADPTQMKRVAIIGAAAAYTIASADDAMAIKIASETMSNGSRRLGHQLAVALEALNDADAESLDEAYKTTEASFNAALKNEVATLGSILELADDKKTVGAHISGMQKILSRMGNIHLTAIETHMKEAARRLNRKPARIVLTDLEMKAAGIIPKPTSKVKAEGYFGSRGFFRILEEIPEDVREKYPYNRRELGSSSELQALINGERSILEIKQALDAQYERKPKLRSVMNYIEVLKAAGMIEM